jgi:hypothetical protein
MLLLIGVIQNGKMVDFNEEDIPRASDVDNGEIEKSLNCPNMSLSEQECIWIAQRQWDSLVEINLKGNSINEATCFYFSSAKWSHVKSLNLSLNPIKSEGMFWLSKVNMP